MVEVFKRACLESSKQIAARDLVKLSWQANTLRKARGRFIQAQSSEEKDRAIGEWRTAVHTLSQTVDDLQEEIKDSLSQVINMFHRGGARGGASDP